MLILVIFQWDDDHIGHIAEHGVMPREAEYFVERGAAISEGRRKWQEDDNPQSQAKSEAQSNEGDAPGRSVKETGRDRVRSHADPDRHRARLVGSGKTEPRPTAQACR